MNILKRFIIGCIVGILYALSNFYLITPLLRGNIFSILFWGIQGGVFILAWDLLTAFLPNRQPAVLTSLLKGGACGLTASLLHVSISWIGYTQIIAEEGIFVPKEVMRQQNLDLFYYAAGCILIGGLIGLFLRQEQTRNIRVKKGVGPS